MKKIIYFVIASFSLCFLASCNENDSNKIRNENEDIIDGIWGDVIVFSTTEIEFNSKSNKKIITSEGNWWWINDYIEINSKIFPIEDDSDIAKITKGKIEYGAFGVPASEIIFDEGADIEIKKIETEWFTITKKSAQVLEIDVLENKTSKSRNFRLNIQCGNYFTHIDVSQSK